MKIDTDKLQTVNNYAKKKNVTPSWIYKQIRAGKVKMVEIDAVKFVKL